MPTTSLGRAWSEDSPTMISVWKEQPMVSRAKAQAQNVYFIEPEDRSPPCPQQWRVRELSGRDLSHPPADRHATHHGDGHIRYRQRPSTVLPKAQGVPGKRREGAEAATHADRHEEPHGGGASPKLRACHSTPRQEGRGQHVGRQNRPWKGADLHGTKALAQAKSKNASHAAAHEHGKPGHRSDSFSHGQGFGKGGQSNGA